MADGLVKIIGSKFKIESTVAVTEIAPGTAGQALVTDADGNTDWSDDVELPGHINYLTAQGGGWQDMLGHIVVEYTGSSKPTWAQMGSSVYYAYKFAVNDTCWITYHIPHDYNPATDIFAHAHFTTSGTDVNNVVWKFEYTYAKGFGAGVFDLAATSKTATQTPDGTAWTHYITEISTGISNANFETDGLILMKITRNTNYGTDNADDVFLLMSDIHYQSDHPTTLEKARPFTY